MGQISVKTYAPKGSDLGGNQQNYASDSEEFKHLTPLIVGVANAGEILIDLIRVSNSAETVAEIAPKLIELRQIERTDALKLYQGRRRGIMGLQRVVDQGYEHFSKGPHDERELHMLLKAQPWLIRADLNGYLSSDEAMGTVLDRLARRLKIGQYARPSDVNPTIRDDDDQEERELKLTLRPDLVGIVANGTNPDHVFVVELKAPSVPLKNEHLAQLKRYMRQVENFLETEYPARKGSMRVEGALIGAMPKDDTRSEQSLDLLSEIEKQQGVNSRWEVIGLNEMLARTERVHSDMLAALNRDEQNGLLPTTHHDFDDGDGII